MRTFNYSAIKEQKWDSDVLGLIAAIYKEAGKQELYLKQRPEELEKLVEIAKIHSTEASNAIEGIVTTSTRIRQLVEEKTTPRNRDEQEIAGYRDVLSIIHESFDAIPITQNYILKNVANELETDYRFKKGAYADNIRNFLWLYNEISLALKEDTELVNLFQSQLTDTCYPDPELKTLTIDVGFYISRFYSQQDENAEAATEWYGTDYNPGLTIENWKKLLKDGAIFTTSALEIMKRIKDYGGQASCTQLEVKYGETKNFYNSGSVALAHRVCEAAGIKPATREDGSAQWWTVLYTGRDADKGEDGSFIWKLRLDLPH